MGFATKTKNLVEELTGAAKERVGDVCGDERLRVEGLRQRDDARARQAREERARQSDREWDRTGAR
ncbi:CsbD family protein [Salinispora cortesiana]|uniref:CsbD family protein n=1 Tax=Salinispora cortesiana TaxID=1305843 RepID=UPI0003F53F34|nr:CsbD family protein [Salinispora cortesiana]